MHSSASLACLDEPSLTLDQKRLVFSQLFGGPKNHPNIDYPNGSFVGHEHERAQRKHEHKGAQRKVGPCQTSSSDWCDEGAWIPLRNRTSLRKAHSSPQNSSKSMNDNNMKETHVQKNMITASYQHPRPTQKFTKNTTTKHILDIPGMFLPPNKSCPSLHSLRSNCPHRPTAHPRLGLGGLGAQPRAAATRWVGWMGGVLGCFGCWAVGCFVSSLDMKRVGSKDKHIALECERLRVSACLSVARCGRWLVGFRWEWWGIENFCTAPSHGSNV